MTKELYEWATGVFSRIGLDLSDALQLNEDGTYTPLVPSLGISMASIDKGLNLTKDEHEKMSRFLKLIPFKA